MRIRTIGTLAALVLAVPLATAAFAQGTDVTVEDNSYEPQSLTVTAGDTVTWTQTGSNPHTVTADDGSFDSHPDCNSFSDSAGGNCMSMGNSYSEQFTEPGTYPYYCKIHGAPGGQGMAGTIVVEAAATTGGTTDGGDTTDGSTDGGDTTTDGSTDGADTTTDGADTTTTDGSTDGGDTTTDAADTTTTDGSADDGSEQADTEADSLPRTGSSAVALLVALAALAVSGGALVVRAPGS